MKDVEKLKTITFFLLCMYRDQNQGNHDDAVDREDGGGGQLTCRRITCCGIWCRVDADRCPSHLTWVEVEWFRGERGGAEEGEKEEERSRGGAHGTCLDFEGGAKLIGTSYWIYRGPYPMFITYRWSPRQANHTSQGTHFALVSQQMVPKERSIRQVVAIVSNSSKPHLGRSNTCGNSMDL